MEHRGVKFWDDSVSEFLQKIGGYNVLIMGKLHSAPGTAVQMTKPQKYESGTFWGTGRRIVSNTKYRIERLV